MKKQGIIIFGANGSGKTTLGRELARVLGFVHMDIEDYYFEQSEIPCTVKRSREDCLNLLLSDIEKYRAFVLSAVTGDFGDVISQYYNFAVFLSAPKQLRIERVKRRCVEKFGEMNEQSLEFVDFVSTRSLEFIEQWSDTLSCPVICVDGTIDWRANAEYIAEQYKNNRTVD
jgi:Uridine kinase